MVSLYLASPLAPVLGRYQTGGRQRSLLPAIGLAGGASTTPAAAWRAAVPCGSSERWPLLTRGYRPAATPPGATSTLPRSPISDAPSHRALFLRTNALQRSCPAPAQLPVALTGGSRSTVPKCRYMHLRQGMYFGFCFFLFFLLNLSNLLLSQLLLVLMKMAIFFVNYRTTYYGFPRVNARGESVQTGWRIERISSCTKCGIAHSTSSHATATILPRIPTGAKSNALSFPAFVHATCSRNWIPAPGPWQR